MKKVLILGLANTMEDAPIEYDGDIWTCNDGAIRRTRKHGRPYITAMFDAHNLNVAELSEMQAAMLCESFNIPIYGVQEYPWLRTSQRYPYEDACGIMGMTLFSDVVCYMIAYAILKEYEHIDLVGVHMHPEHRDNQESAIVHLWLGIAMGKGIKVNVMDYDDVGCAILKNGEYWTGQGSYGHWDPQANLIMEIEARSKPREEPQHVIPVQGANE
jgi:hypothetical protein